MGNLFEVVAKIMLDTGDYEKNVKGATKKSKDLQKSFEESARYSETLENKLKVLASQHESAKKEVDKLTDAFNKAAKEKGADSKEAQELAEKLKDAENKADGLQKEMDDLTQSTAKSGKEFDSAGSKLSNFADKLKTGLATATKVGAAAIGTATAAVTAFAKSSIDAGMQFDSAMSQVAAVSGATGDDFDALRAKAMEMGSKTKFSATESAEAFNYMAMAGWKTEDMLNGIEGIMNLAAASGEDLATTSDIVTDALTAFGLSAGDSAHFADILAVASSNANTNVSMMGETFKYVAPVAGSLGYSAEDVAEAIGLMANSGIKASQAGTALRSIISRLSTDAGASSNSLGALGTLTEELGVEFFEANGQARALGDVLSEARVAWSKLSEEEQINYGNTIAGMEGMSAWMAIMNASEADIQKLSSAIDNADGAALKMANTMQDNLAGDITIFKSALEGAKITLSDQLTPSLREFVQFGTEGVSSLTAAFQEGGFSGTMEEFGNVLGDAVTKITEKLPEIVEAGRKLLEALLQGIVDNLPTIMPAIVEVINQIATFIVDNLPMLIDAAIEIILALANGLTESLPELIPAVVDAIITIVDTLIDNVDQLVDAAIEIIMALADGLIEALPKLLDKAPEIIEKLVKAIVDNAPKLLAAAGELIGKLVVGIIDNLPELGKAAGRIIGAVVKGLGDLLIKIKDVGKDMIKKLWDGITGMGDWIKSKVSGFFDGVVGGIKDFLGIHSPSRVFSDIGENMALGLGKGWDESFSKVSDDIQSGLDFNTDLAYNTYSDRSAFGGSANGYGQGTQVVQNIYSQAKTAADLMEEARWNFDMAVAF